MKKAKVILLSFVFVVSASVGYCGTVDFPYEVGTWQGFRKAAITYSFDDNCYNQYLIAIPMLNQYDYDGTFFLVTDWVTDWTPWQIGAAEGHEIASHTVTHTRLKGLNETDQIYEYSESQATINANILGEQGLTIAYPNCRSGTEALCAQFYIAGRNCSGGYNPPTPENFYEIKANICGSRGSVKDMTDFIERNEAAATAGGWQVYLLHGIDDDGGYSPLSSTILQESLNYLDARRSTYWVSTFLRVVKYIKERDDVSVMELPNQVNSITVQVTDTLDNAFYDEPLTIRRPLPTGWSTATVTQAAQPIDSSIIAVSGITYVMFDAVPDGGDVVILKGEGDTTPPAAPTNLAAEALSPSQIDLDWYDNSEGDLASYNVYRDGSPVARGVSYSQYSDTGLSPLTRYCYTVTAVDTSNNESMESNQACATTQEGSGNTLHVDFINVWLAGAKNKKATAGVAIVDNSGAPIANATVTGTFTGDFNETRSGVTDDSGQVEIQSVGSGSATSHFTFCVDDVTHAELAYDPDANVETCESR